MLIFYTKKNCRECDEIQAAIRDLTLAHKTVAADGQPRPESIPPDASPPILVDEDEVVVGAGPIRAHLEKLRAFKAQWEKYQSDACYGDDDSCSI